MRMCTATAAHFQHLDQQQAAPTAGAGAAAPGSAPADGAVLAPASGAAAGGATPQIKGCGAMGCGVWGAADSAGPVMLVTGGI
jgi:hypothetical protein